VIETVARRIEGDKVFLNQIKEKILELADFLVKIQYATDLRKGWYGGFPSIEGGVFYYTIDGCFAIDALLDAYEFSGRRTYLDTARRAGSFLRHMQTRHEADLVDKYYGGFCEYVRSDTEAYLTRMHTKNLLAVSALNKLYGITTNSLYATMRDDALSFLRYGLENYYHYYNPLPYGDNAWHREGIPETNILADDFSYALRSVYEYEGLTTAVRNIYNFLQSISTPNYNPRFAWAGYLNVVDKIPAVDYYDVVTSGLLKDIRSKIDVESYRFSIDKLVELGSKAFYWGLKFNWEPVDRWQNTATVSSIGLYLIEAKKNYPEALKYVLKHAPYIRYDPKTNEYDPVFGRTPGGASEDVLRFLKAAHTNMVRAHAVWMVSFLIGAAIPILFILGVIGASELIKR